MVVCVYIDIFSHRYRKVGGPVFAVFFLWRVTIITLDPEDIKVWSLLTLPMRKLDTMNKKFPANFSIHSSCYSIHSLFSPCDNVHGIGHHNKTEERQARKLCVVL